MWKENQPGLCMKTQGPKRNYGAHCRKEEVIPKMRAPPQRPKARWVDVLKVNTDDLEDHLRWVQISFRLSGHPSLIFIFRPTNVSWGVGQSQFRHNFEDQVILFCFVGFGRSKFDRLFYFYLIMSPDRTKWWRVIHLIQKNQVRRCKTKSWKFWIQETEMNSWEFWFHSPEKLTLFHFPCNLARILRSYLNLMLLFHSSYYFS